MIASHLQAGRRQQTTMSSKEAIIGLDIGGTNTNAVAFDDQLVELADLHLPTVAGSVETVADSILETIAALNDKLNGTPLAGVGIGIPGLVNPESGMVRQAVNLGIADEPLAIVDRVEEEFDVPCQIENDVNLAALGAHHILASDRNVLDLAYLSIGTGIAAGVVLNGHLHRGKRGVAGEIGHFPASSDGPQCACGLHGCLEVFASGSAIARQWPATGATPPMEDLLSAATSGDKRANETLRQITDHLAKAVYLLAITYDVDRIVIGGGVAEAGTRLLDEIRNGVRRLENQSDFVRTLQLTERVILKPAGPLGAIGAGALVLVGGQT
jgi:glucokinase